MDNPAVMFLAGCAVGGLIVALVIALALSQRSGQPGIRFDPSLRRPRRRP